MTEGKAVPGLRDIRISTLVGLACLLVYSANLRVIGAGDTLPARYVPFGIWHSGSVLLDPIRKATAQDNSHPYWIQRGRAGHSVSLYPVVLPVLVAPLYLPAVGYLNVQGWTAERLRCLATFMEKLTATLIACAASSLLYLLLRRRARASDALLLTLAFAFGTNTWMIGSQALWQHGLAELLVIGLLLLLTAPCTTPRAVAAGVLCGLILGNRPPDVILAAALGMYGLVWAGRRAPWLAAGAALPLGIVLSYNFVAAGNLAGGYGIALTRVFFRNGLLAGVAGLLFSPTRGLFVFSPFLVIVPAALWRGLQTPARALTLVIGVAVLIQVLLYAKADWRGGYSWGPRWLTDVLPLLIWLLPPVLAALGSGSRVAFVIAICASIVIQAVGAFWYTTASDATIFAVQSGPDKMRAAWDLRNTPFIAELRHGPAAPDPVFTKSMWNLRALGSRAAAPAKEGATLPSTAQRKGVVPANSWRGLNRPPRD